MIVGEAPGADEDASGRPFVGAAGKLLDKMLASIELFRDKNCFIANTIKCRPPHNRDPQQDEIEACAAHLERQIRILKPLVLFCTGRFAAQRLLNTNESIQRLRGHFAEYENIPVLVSYHPSALLHNETYKRPAWEDLKLLKAKINSLESEGAAQAGDV
jgi:DNA polymerase